MDINKLKTFVHLANTLNFSETAADLYMSQSSVSKQIKSLEKELEQPLFIRNNREVIISKFGKSILDEASKIVDLDEKIVTKATRMNSQQIHQIALGVIPSFYHNNIFQKIIDYQDNHPAINVLLREIETNKLLTSLNERRIDLGYMRSLKAPSKLNYDCLVVSQEKFMVCLNPKHPLAKEQTIDLQQLKNENFIMLTPHSLLYQPVIDLCHEAGFEPKISFVSERVSSIIQMVKNNQGVAIIMQPRSKRPGVALRPLVPTKTSYLFFIKDKQNNSMPVKRIWNYLQKFTIPNENN